MKISAKGRYALAALTYMARTQPGGSASGCEAVTVIKISERLGISKIYLEQTFSLLKRAGLVSAVKGSQGGYFLAHSPEEITALHILSAIENAMFEDAEKTVADNAPDIDASLQEAVFSPLDNAIRQSLDSVTLAGLVAHAEEHRQNNGYMFFI